jgi:hypothetical protein
VAHARLATWRLTQKITSAFTGCNAAAGTVVLAKA